MLLEHCEVKLIYPESVVVTIPNPNVSTVTWFSRNIVLQGIGADDDKN
jgi:hypothetical protein